MKHLLQSKLCSPRVGSQKDESITRLRLVFDSLACRLRVLPHLECIFAALFLLFGAGQMFAAEEVAYTLDGTTQGGTSAYTLQSITQSSKDWKVQGNTNVNPWRIGVSKSGSSGSADFPIYSQTAISENVTKIILTHGAVSHAEVNSVTIQVYSTADLAAAGGDGDVSSDVTSADSWSDDETMTFNRPTGHDWTGRFYRIVYNINCSPKSGNKGYPAYMTFTSAVFKYESASCSNAPTVTAGSLKGSVSASSSATAQCTGGITNIGGAGCSLTSYGFAVGTASNPSIGGTLTSGGKTYEVGSSIAASTGFEKLIDGLAASTTYYARPYATNGAGTGYGTQFSFTTLAACTAAPTVTGGTTGTITSTSAVLNCSSGISKLGTGGCAIESYGFVMNTTGTPTISDTKYEVGTTYTTTGTSFTKTVSSGLTEGTTYYVRPYATNGYDTGYGTQTSFSTPKITVSETARAFGDRAVGGLYTMTFTVSGTYLQSNISIAKSGTNSSLFSIDNATVTQTDGTAPTTTITVTYAPTSAGSHSATLTLTSTNATSKTVSLSGTGKWTVTFLNGTGGTHSTALVANSTAPSKPGSDPSACDATSTTFVGWTQTAWSGKKAQSYVDALTAANVKVYTSSDDLPAMTDDVTYYPVFAKATGTPSDEWGLVTSTSGLSAGDKIVIANAPSGTIYVMGKDTVTEAGFQFRRVAQVSSFTVSSNKITISTIASSSTDRNNPHAMTVGKSGDYWTFYDPLNSAYLSCVSTSEKNSLGYETTLSDAGKWALTFSSNRAAIVSQISSDITTRNQLQANGNPFGTASSFTCVANTQTDPSIFKNLSIVSYSDYLTTCCDKNITIGDPDITGTGTVAFSVGGSALAVDDVVETCSAAKNIVVRVTPGSGYECTSLSFSDGTNSLTPSPTTASTLPFGYDDYTDYTLSFSKETTSITLETEVTFSAKALTGWSWKYKKGADAASDGVDPYTIPETVEVYKNEYARFFIVGYDPEDVIDSKKGFVYVSSDDSEEMQPVYDKSELSYSSKNAACSYYQLYGKKVVESSTITFKSAGNASLTKTFTIKVKALPSVTFVDLIHNKTDFINWGTDGVVSSTVTTGVVTHVKPTPTHTDLTEPATGNSCEKTHLHLIGWIRSDYSKVADYMNGTGSEPTVSELTGAGTGYWFTPGADINIETYNGKTFYAVWAVEE